MSKDRKPRQESDGTKPPLRQLKERSMDEREWAYSLSKQMTSEQARGEIRERLGISLRSDSSFSEFLSWQFHQQRLANYNQRQEQFEEFYRKSDPSASAEKVRAAGIAFFMSESVANNDRDGFVDVAALSLSENKGVLEVKKFALNKEKVQLQRQKLELDVSKLAMKEAATIKTISASKLTETEKLEAIRKKLFGQLPLINP